MLTSVAQWEREASGERTRDELAQVRREGIRLGGAALEWTRTEATDENGRRILAAVADEVAAIERIEALRAEGPTLRQIAATLPSAVRTRESIPGRVPAVRFAP